MRKTILIALWATLVLGSATSASAQRRGPPIPPQQQFDAQPRPSTQLPPVYVPPVGNSGTTYSY